MRVGGLAVAVLVAVVTRPAPAVADPLRLRGDALASVQAPAGLIVLEAGEDALPWLDAEALVWTGGGDADRRDLPGDVLVMVVEIRDPAKRGSVRIGRHVVTTGALPQLHVDGVSARARLPQRFELEAFGGLPVVPRMGPRAWDWVVGARLARPLGPARVGIAWMERREHGALHTHEVALDGGARVRGVETAVGAAWDLIGEGLAEVRVTAGKRWRAVRGDVFVTHRSPAHLLPATSLFSVLGDVPATLGGADVRWRAAPRLDVGGRAGLRLVDGGVREDLTARASLRLDDRGAGALGVELRRQGADEGGWTGVRGFARVPVRPRWTASAEAELARPDEPRGRGAMWPWGLAALAWRPEGWELACAVEAASTPEHRWRVDGLVRVTRAWSGR